MRATELSLFWTLESESDFFSMLTVESESDIKKLANAQQTQVCLLSPKELLFGITSSYINIDQNTASRFKTEYF